MKITASIAAKLTQMVAHYTEIEHRMGDEETLADNRLYQSLAKEYAQLQPVVEAHRHYQTLQQALADCEGCLADTDDEMRVLAEEELPSLQAALAEQEQQLCMLLLPKDPDDACNAFVEVRAGTGGLEAGLFAADLCRMYQRYAETKRWKISVVSCHENESGGFKEVILHLKGPAVYEVMKYESGTHRVQRVPSTESQGRIHTSACTVAVMPEIEVVEDFEIDPNDLRIDTYRASGAGGQHVNKTDSAVRITHLPTDTVVECQEERSQHKNKAKALKILQTKIVSAQRAAQKAAEAQQRKLLVGSGDRSERIRTYNFPQGRLTDHRINLTLYALSDVLEGQLDQVLLPLRQEDQAQQMAAYKE